MSKVQRIASGVLGGSKYEFEFLPARNTDVVIHLREDAALKVLWWAFPEYAGMPLGEVPRWDDSDTVCDDLRDALERWVRTFPLVSDTGATA